MASSRLRLCAIFLCFNLVCLLATYLYLSALPVPESNVADASPADSQRQRLQSRHGNDAPQHTSTPPSAGTPDLPQFAPSSPSTVQLTPYAKSRYELSLWHSLEQKCYSYLQLYERVYPRDFKQKPVTVVPSWGQNSWSRDECSSEYYSVCFCVCCFGLTALSCCCGSRTRPSCPCV